MWNADGTSRRVFEPGFGGFGTTIGLALSPTRLYASPNMNWPGPQYDSHPFTIALQL